MSKKQWWIVVGVALVAAIAVIFTYTLVRGQQTTVAATPVPTVVATPSASATPSATPTATESPSATTEPSSSAPATQKPTSPETTKPTQSPTVTDPTQPSTPTIDTSTWPKPIDCSNGTPPPEHIAYCKVKGKTQVQIFEACKAAALGTLWLDSPGHKLGKENSHLQADIETCVRGSGLEKNSADSNVLGYPSKNGKLLYILVLGWDTGVNDSYAHVFNATGEGSDIGFIAFDETELITKIISFYEEFANESQ